MVSEYRGRVIGTAVTVGALILAAPLWWPLLATSGFLNWPGWLVLNVAACWVGLVIAASFPIRYHFTTGGAWHRTSEGRWMLYGRALIAFVLALTLINYYFPGWPGRRFASFVMFALFIAHLYWPHLLLSRANRDHLPEGKTHDGDPGRHRASR